MIALCKGQEVVFHLAALISIPILVSILYRFWSSLPFIAVHAALDAVEGVGSCDPGLVAIETRRIADGGDRTTTVTDHDERAGWSRPVPLLSGYDALLKVGSTR